METILQNQKEYFANISNNLSILAISAQSLKVEKQKFKDELSNFENEFEKNLDQTLQNYKKKIMDQIKTGNESYMNQIDKFEQGNDFLNHYIKSQEKQIGSILQQFDILYNKISINKNEETENKNGETDNLNQLIFMMNNSCDQYFSVYKILSQFQNSQQKTASQIIDNTKSIQDVGQQFLLKFQDSLEQNFQNLLLKDSQNLKNKFGEIYQNIEDLKNNLAIFQSQKKIYQDKCNEGNSIFEKVKNLENYDIQEIETKHVQLEHKDYFNHLNVNIKVIQNIDDIYLFTGGWDGSVQIFDIQKDNKSLQFFEKLHKKPIKQIQKLDNGCIGIIGEDSVLTILDYNQQDETFMIKKQMEICIPQNVVKKLEKNFKEQQKAHPNKKTEKSKYVSDEEIEQQQQKEYQDLLKGIKQNLFSISTSQNINYLDTKRSWILLAGEQNLLYFYDMLDYKLLKYKFIEDHKQNNNVICSKIIKYEDKMLGVLGCENGDLYIIDLDMVLAEDGEAIKNNSVVLKQKIAHGDWIYTLDVQQISKDKFLLVTGGYDNKVKIWQIWMSLPDQDLVNQSTFSYGNRECADIQLINEVKCADQVKQVSLFSGQQVKQDGNEITMQQIENNKHLIQREKEEKGDQENQNDSDQKQIQKQILVNYVLGYVSENYVKIVNQDQESQQIKQDKLDSLNQFTQLQNGFILAGVSEKPCLYYYKQKNNE